MSVHTHAYLQTYSMYKHTNATFISSYKYIRKRRKRVFRHVYYQEKNLHQNFFVFVPAFRAPRQSHGHSTRKNKFGAIRTSLFLWANQRSRVPQPFCLNTMTVFRIWKENIHASKDTVRIMQSGETDIIWLR